MLLQVLKYDVFGDGAVGGREVPASPKPPAPVAFLELREFALHLVGGPPLHQPHEVTYSQLGRDRHEHVDVIGRQHAADDVDTLLAAHLATDIADPKSNIACQHLVAILGRPDEVIAVIENAVAAGGILHDRILGKMNLRPGSGSFFRGYDHKTILSR